MKRTNMKKGITLIEIILAIVLIAIIMGLTIPKLMSNSEKAEIKQVITSDVKSIVEAAVMWKKSSAAAQGNFQNISVANLIARLPDSMETDGVRGLIFSSGLNTGTVDRVGATQDPATGVVYTVSWAFDATNHTESGRFSIGMDIQNGMNDLNWNDNIQAYAREVFADVMTEVTDGDLTPHNTDVQTTGGTPVTFKCATAAETVCYYDVRIN